MHISIGRGKSATRGYSLDEVAIVPSRRTREAERADLSWEIDAYKFGAPILAAPNDAVSSPASAAILSATGGAAVLHGAGLWARHEDPTSVLAKLAELGEDDELLALELLRDAYLAPVQTELLMARIAEIKGAGSSCVVAVSPSQVEEMTPHLLKAEPDLLMIHAPLVSAEHVSSSVDTPLNLKTFIRRFELPVLVGGCASYKGALHLMRTGAAGVIVRSNVEVEGELGLAAPLATAIADARAARLDHLDETGVYCHVLAEGGLRTGGDIAKAVACGADAVILDEVLAGASDAPGGGWWWDHGIAHATLPIGALWRETELGEPAPSIQQMLTGPGVPNLFGALRKSMALAGFESIKELQQAELMVTR